MEKQKFQQVADSIKQQFIRQKQENHANLGRPLELSWCNCFSGNEPLEQQGERLRANGVCFIELHGNHYGEGEGYSVQTVTRMLTNCDLRVSGIVALSDAAYDLSSNDAICRRRAIDRLRREVDFAQAVGAAFIDILPSALGRRTSHDEEDLARCAESLREITPFFEAAGIQGAIEPINAFEVGLIHSFEDANALLGLVGISPIRWINGDLFHMHCAEDNVPQSILDAADHLINLHLMDSNREAIGHGMYDIDTVIMALYLAGHNVPGRFVTGEPLAASLSVGEAIHGLPPREVQDRLVRETVTYFRQRERAVLESLY